MAGIDTVRGISYQHAHSVLSALNVVADPDLAAVRVEGLKDVVDIEALDHAGQVALAQQVKTRGHAYTWGRAELLGVLRRWAALDMSTSATFEFVTDGRLGPTGAAVRSALDDAASGELGPISKLLGVAVTDPVCEVAARCRIRQDDVGVEPILAVAEREVRTLHAGQRSAPDAELAAQHAVDRLFRVISVRAGAVEADDRVLAADEILEIIGGTATVPRADRWGDELRAEYVQAVLAVEAPPAVAPRLLPLNGLGGDDGNGFATALQTLLNGPRCATVSGPTGAGKSTMAMVTRGAAAAAGTLVIVTHAEAYTPGRLDSLVAESVSAVVGRELPSLTGRQALDDAEVVLVVDGVSEVPSGVRAGLASEVRPSSAVRAGARLLLVGRDMAALVATFGVTATVGRYVVSSFDRAERARLTATVLADLEVEGPTPDPEVGLARAERALADAAGNPMLLTMALRLLAAGTDFHDRASLYEGVVKQMADRMRSDDVSIATAALGVTYAGLLDEGRRYASQVEWQRRVTAACAHLESLGVDAAREAVLGTVDRCGLVTRVDTTQVLVPVHDSFADYLAGCAHASGLVSLPPVLASHDEQRVLFAAEVATVDDGLAASASVDLPFVCPQLADHDERGLGDDSPGRIATALSSLSPRVTGGVCMWRSGARVVASLVEGEQSAWVEAPEGRALVGRWPTAVLRDSAGPLAVAVRLWPFAIAASMDEAGREDPPRLPRTLEEAAAALTAHALETASEVEVRVTRAFSDRGAEALLRALGPLGLRAVVYEDASRTDDGDFAVAYEPRTDVSVAAGAEDAVTDVRERFDGNWGRSLGGRTGIRWLLRESPAATANRRIREAANRLAGMTWL